MNNKDNKYLFAVGAIRKINGSTVKCNLFKYKVCDEFGNYPIPTSLSKWFETDIVLTDEQMEKFNSLANEDSRRAYLTVVHSISKL